MCTSPITLQGPPPRVVPCSKCPECRSRRVSGWSLRLMRQDRLSSNSQFLTLTYDSEKTDTEGKPLPNRTPNGFTTLNKRHVQLFIKRLRFYCPEYAGSLKYYACGEYGSRTKRPHYHIIMFNAPSIEQIRKAWGMGIVYPGSVREASVGYCLKYINKGRTVPAHRRDDRQPEFQLVSKGLGANYLTPRMIAWHQADPVNRVYAPMEDGKKAHLPRYLRERIFTDDQKQQIKLHYEQKFLTEQFEALDGLLPHEIRAQKKAREEVDLNQKAYTPLIINQKDKI